MRKLLKEHEGSLVAISKWKSTKKRYHYRLLIDLDVIISDSTQLVSIYPNAIDHLWVSKTLLCTQAFQTPYFCQPLILGKINPYQRLDHSIDYGIDLLSQSELKLAQLIFGYAPVLATLNSENSSSFKADYLQSILQKTSNLIDEVMRDFSEISLSNLSQLSQVAIIQQLWEQTSNEVWDLKSFSTKL